jgi:oligopeptide/dipeptide ABC transporter ATP-binding protein
MSLLTVKNLNVSFSIHKKKLHAVRGISFGIDVGEIVGLVGESGCGKSATVQALLRLDPSQQIEGEAIFKGEDLLTKSIKELNRIRGPQIGMIFQDPMTALNPTMKIGEQIAEGLIYHQLASRKKALQKAVELLELVGISDPKNCVAQYPHVLSGGMRQRVMIAIAIACGPKLIIADEPTTALDVTISSQILTLLKSLCQRLETSLLLITHDLSVIASVCDRVLVMYAGEIVESASVEEIFYRPKHPYTKMLLQAIPRLDRPKSERLIPIEGAPPSLFEQFKGCPFAPRCPRAIDQCKNQHPTLSDGVACWRPHD